LDFTRFSKLIDNYALTNPLAALTETRLRNNREGGSEGLLVYARTDVVAASVSSPYVSHYVSH
jgi:hypothetical protein